jgi:oxaloacetate decarboxylase (Na+ extruding) subunit alpha
MATIEFIDQTLRDGQQSLWGMRLQAQDAAESLPHLDQTGFRTIDLTGGGPFIVLVRSFRADPWATLDFIVSGLPSTPRRAGVRSVAVGGFGFMPDAIIDLWVHTLARHGINSLWLFDCLYDLPKMKRTAQAIRAGGADVVPAIMYGLTDVHTDEFFATRAAEMASWDGVETIYVEDAPGVLTPERARTLLPALQEATGDVRLELHCHNTTGLAALNYIEGIKAGIEIIHTCSLPMANGPSLPSTEALVEIVEDLGHTHNLDKRRLRPVADSFYATAAAAGYAVGVPNEYRLAPYKHQLPGGMTGTLINQLAQHGMADRLDDVIEEIVVVREELGQPIMATPFSQFVGIQAVLNIVLGERYKVVPDEVVQYALGHYGPLPQPVQPDVMDRILSVPRATELASWEQPQPTLKEIRDQLGGSGLSDEELLLRYLLSKEEVDSLLEAPPIRTAPRVTTSNVLSMVKDLAAAPRSFSRVTLDRPDIRVDLRRSPNGAA